MPSPREPALFSSGRVGKETALSPRDAVLCFVLFYFAALVLAKAAEPTEGGWERVSFCIPNSSAAPQLLSEPLPMTKPELLYMHFHPNQ